MSGNNIGTVLHQLTKLAQLDYAMFQKVNFIAHEQNDLILLVKYLIVLHIVSVFATLWYLI